MAVRGPLSRLFRSVLSSCCPQSRAHLSVAIVGAPFSKGQKRRGVELGPKAIRDAGVVERLASLENAVHDFGDLSFEHLEEDDRFMNVPFPRTVGRANQILSDAMSRAVGAGHTAVMLGGDHSLAIGSVAGHAQQRPDLCLIWVDAHADINTPMTSPSGNLHGQPVAFMLKELQDKMPAVPGFSWMKPFLAARDLVYIGLRDVDPGEHVILKSLGIQCFTMRDIDRLGMQRVMEVTLDHLLARKRRPIHLSFDIDAFDPTLAPATGTPVNGGLTYREGMYITEEIHNTGLLSAMDLVEVNPALGASSEAVEATAGLAVDVIASSLGQTRELQDTEQLGL
ncbi:arginase-2, mitochondrial isoform X1 [Ictalurus furcatus]|uniref:arginase-2, mitochondrial isoform X1 n=1 Tax=Ictalurus furcatus TaxID=66913 RepID=UPI0023502BFD|nr:arginase-2, mitochondrial isoform X1 [Ictalurus furcatus]